MQIKNHLLLPIYQLIILIALGVAGCTGKSESEDEVSQPAAFKDSPSTREKKVVASAQLPATVAQIQKAYAGIIKKFQNGGLDSAVFKYSCDGEKGGTISYFTENKQLRMIVHNYHEYDHYSATDRYFIQDSSLFFAHTKSISWSFESGPEGSTKDNITEKRTYMLKGRPLKCLEKKYVIRSKATDNPRPETLPNREVDCPPAATVFKPYQLLIKFLKKPTTGCLTK
ncbi:hypothetical protein OQY15_20480 [Pedobacter sp. MC2016-15]|uniref:hypothetical protein n=1 Tax=Pedobacter sp. MC2016-15 TaxID=2994473 RepID=UPI002246C2A0|nr:hypothetical protein [Pedobacter sp. MC2016-15]MCX2481488.1 hypothetical protein [Pedobacter sp. MC2016-15]